MQWGQPFILLQLRQGVEEIIDIGHVRGYSFKVVDPADVWVVIRRHIWDYSSPTNKLHHSDLTLKILALFICQGPQQNLMQCCLSLIIWQSQ